MIWIRRKIYSTESWTMRPLLKLCRKALQGDGRFLQAGDVSTHTDPILSITLLGSGAGQGPTWLAIRF